MPTLSLFSGSEGLGVIAIAAFLVLVAMLLLSRLIRRDPQVRSTKFGWYIERERYDDEPPWPEPRPPENRTLPQWPDRDKTAELEPQQQPEPGPGS